MVTSGDHGGRCGQDHITAGRSKDKLLIQCYCDIADVTHLELTALHCRTLLRTSVGIKAVDVAYQRRSDQVMRPSSARHQDGRSI